MSTMNVDTSIWTKVAQVQSKLGALKKKAEGQEGYQKYNYLTLEDLNSHLLPLLQEAGLALISPIQDNQVVTTLVEVETGNNIQSCMPLDPSLPIKDRGSEITYCRRYTILSLLNISTEDDDGEGPQRAQTRSTGSSGSNYSHPEGGTPLPGQEGYDWNGKTPLEQIPEEQLTWLNQFTKKGGTELTQDYQRALNALAQGYTINELRCLWKISRDVKDALAADHQKGGDAGAY